MVAMMNDMNRYGSNWHILNKITNPHPFFFSLSQISSMFLFFFGFFKKDLYDKKITPKRICYSFFFFLKEGSGFVTFFLRPVWMPTNFRLLGLALVLPIISV